MSEPIVIVHGYLASKALMVPLQRRLEREGFDAHLVDLTVLALADVRKLSKQLAGNVDRIRAETGAERVSLLGVSLGGFVALHYVKRLGGDRYVKRIVAVGAPFHGTWFAALGVPLLPFSRPVWQSLPNSAFLEDLRQGPCPVPLVTVAIPGDIVAPPARCRLPDAREVLIAPTWFPAAHQWLVISRRVTRQIARILRED